MVKKLLENQTIYKIVEVIMESERLQVNELFQMDNIEVDVAKTDEGICWKFSTPENQQVQIVFENLGLQKYQNRESQEVTSFHTYYVVFSIVEDNGYNSGPRATGKNSDQHFIMSAVVSLLFRFLLSHKGSFLAFSASGSSRIRLYDAIMKRLRSKVKSLGLDINKEDDGEYVVGLPNWEYYLDF